MVAGDALSGLVGILVWAPAFAGVTVRQSHRSSRAKWRDGLCALCRVSRIRSTRTGMGVPCPPLCAPAQAAVHLCLLGEKAGEDGTLHSGPCANPPSGTWRFHEMGPCLRRGTRHARSKSRRRSLHTRLPPAPLSAPRGRPPVRAARSSGRRNWRRRCRRGRRGSCR
jgi:hypothetical protein